jgi:hypothetical protein
MICSSRSARARSASSIAFNVLGSSGSASAKIMNRLDREPHRVASVRVNLIHSAAGQIPQKWIRTQLRRGALRAMHEASGRYLFQDTQPAMQAVRQLRERRMTHVDLTGGSA